MSLNIGNLEHTLILWDIFSFKMWGIGFCKQSSLKLRMKREESLAKSKFSQCVDGENFGTLYKYDYSVFFIKLPHTYEKAFCIS